MNGQQLARGLGWFSIGLGLAEVTAPRALARTLGLGDRAGVLPGVYGLREIGAGVGLLTRRNPARLAPWVWARVGGDALDIATLGAAALNPRNPRRANAGVALAAVAGVTLLDVLCARRLGERATLP